MYLPLKFVTRARFGSSFSSVFICSMRGTGALKKKKKIRKLKIEITEKILISLKEENYRCGWILNAR